MCDAQSREKKNRKLTGVPTDLFALLVSGRVVRHLEVVEVQNVLHLVVVPSSLADNSGHIKQKDVSGKNEPSQSQFDDVPA